MNDPDQPPTMHDSDNTSPKAQDDHLPDDVIIRCLNQKPMRHESRSKFFRRITQICLQNKKFDRIQRMDKLKNIQVIYLYNNLISKIENLDFASHLTGLYLENNRIHAIGGLASLRSLTKLNLKQNHIRMLEGLDHCERLQELYISDQRLPRGVAMGFSGDTLRSLASSLAILDISNNNIVDVEPCSVLVNLEVLKATGNRIADIEPLVTLFRSCYSLREADFTGNPVTSSKSYRDTVIMSAELLTMLDRKEVRENQRQFLHARNHQRRMRVKGSSSSKQRPEVALGDERQEPDGRSPRISSSRFNGYVPTEHQVTTVAHRRNPPTFSGRSTFHTPSHGETGFQGAPTARFSLRAAMNTRNPKSFGRGEAGFASNFRGSNNASMRR